jgi:hypothetical protein
MAGTKSEEIEPAQKPHQDILMLEVTEGLKETERRAVGSESEVVEISQAK